MRTTNKTANKATNEKLKGNAYKNDTNKTTVVLVGFILLTTLFYILGRAEHPNVEVSARLATASMQSLLFAAVFGSAYLFWDDIA